MWVWGVVNAVLIMLVIYCNGRGWRTGWALGFAAQCWLILFGVLGAGPWTFVLSAGPAAMFAVNWWLHPRRVARRLMVDAAIVRAAVIASHEQPSPILKARVGMTAKEAAANLTANAEKYLPHITLKDMPADPKDPIYPYRMLPDKVEGDLSFPVDPDQVDRVGHYYAYATGRSDNEPSVSTEQVMAIMAKYGGTPAQYLDHWLRIHPALSAATGRPLPSPYGVDGWMRPTVADKQPVTGRPPGSSTDIMASTGHLGGTPKDPPGGCLLCPGGAEVPQTELIEHLISHHPQAYDGSPFETWPVDDTTSQEGDHE
jgi:hypothetical protein